MTLIFIDPTVMRSGFATVSVLFLSEFSVCIWWRRTGLWYFICDPSSQRKWRRLSAPCFSWSFLLGVREAELGEVMRGIWQTLNLMKDLRVYSAFYSDGGLDLFAYGLATVKHLLWMGLLYLGSLWIFEKRDILNGKKIEKISSA